jgi:hypothetical protein
MDPNPFRSDCPLGPLLTLPGLPTSGWSEKFSGAGEFVSPRLKIASTVSAAQMTSRYRSQVENIDEHALKLCTLWIAVNVDAMEDSASNCR